MMGKTKPKQKSVPIRFKFNKIELLDSNVTLPSNFKSDDTKNMKYRVDLKYKNDRINTIGIILTYFLYYKEDLAFTFSTNSVYGILEEDMKNLNNPLEEKRFSISLIEFSLHQSRGIQSQIFKGQPIEELYMPLIRASQLIDTNDFKA